MLSAIALTGQPAPDAPGRILSSLGDAQINSSGDIAFSAGLYDGRTLLDAILLRSGDTLRKIVDTEAEAPGAPGQKFSSFGLVRLNDAGDIAFQADLGSPPVETGGHFPASGIFLITGGRLREVVLDAPPLFSLNNQGDIVFADGSRVLLFSDGSFKTVATSGQPVLNWTRTLESMSQPWINDQRDIIFVNQRQISPRFVTFFPNAIVRWREGVLEKIAAAEDPVPGVAGAVFDESFNSPHIDNRGRMGFSARMKMKTNANDISTGIVTVEDGRLAVVAREGQVIEGVGKLSFIGLPDFGQQGKLATFVGKVNDGSALGTLGFSGVYTVTPDRFTLNFPHVADGAGPGGGWRTTFILANRSTETAAATVNFYDDSGKPVEVEVGGQRASQFAVSIPSFGVTRFQTDGHGPLKVGWATAQADQRVLSGIAVFELFDDSGKVVSEVGASATVPLRSMSVFAEGGPSTYTGIALVNPNIISANVDLILRDSNAKELTRQTLTVPGMGHIAKYAHELFPGVSLPESGGKIEIFSTQPLVGLTLRQRQGAFASLPVIP